MPPQSRHGIQFQDLMHKVQRLVTTFEQADSPEETVRVVTHGIVEQLRDELAVWGGRLYRRVDDEYVLRSTFGDAKPIEPGLRIPRTYPPIAACLEQGVVLMAPGDPGVDAEIEDGLGVAEFACLEAGQGRFILAFNIAPGVTGDDILFSLEILRQTINRILQEEAWQEVLSEARRIQASIIPRRCPTYASYDIAARIDPQQEVGGDYYDFIEISDKLLGISIADVSGHGLPSALQVRDVRMGIRMGMARDFKIVRTIERLNEIIHHSSLTSRFVALFYGELEPNGNLVYCNAGHIAPVQIHPDGRVRHLDQGGPVLGPLPAATYQRGFTSVEPGDIVVLFTDGIVETADKQERELGVARMVDVVREHRDRSATEIVAAVFDEVERFGHGPVGDDRTLVVIRHE